MNKLTLLLVGVFAFISCQDIEKVTEFNMGYSSSVTIPNSTGLELPFNLLTPDIETNSESEFAINDTRKELVEEIKLTNLMLTITSPENQTFSFLESIEIYISAQGLEEVEVASLDNISANPGKKLTLETSSQDLKEYIKKEKFVLRVKTVTDEFLSKDIDIDINSNFFVNAKILGL